MGRLASVPSGSGVLRERCGPRHGRYLRGKGGGGGVLRWAKGEGGGRAISAVSWPCYTNLLLWSVFIFVPLQDFLRRYVFVYIFAACFDLCFFFRRERRSNFWPITVRQLQKQTIRYT